MCSLFTWYTEKNSLNGNCIYPQLFVMMAIANISGTITIVENCHQPTIVSVDPWIGANILFCCVVIVIVIVIVMVVIVVIWSVFLGGWQTALIRLAPPALLLRSAQDLLILHFDNHEKSTYFFGDFLGHFFKEFFCCVLPLLPIEAMSNFLCLPSKSFSKETMS